MQYNKDPWGQYDSVEYKESWRSRYRIYFKDGDIVYVVRETNDAEYMVDMADFIEEQKEEASIF